MFQYMATAEIYKPKHHVRFVTASSLFDGHDASINIMRRILQSTGAEVIHLGHNRSVEEVVNAAIQEDVQGIAISSYQGGHVEYFKYMYDLFKKKGRRISVSTVAAAGLSSRRKSRNCMITESPGFSHRKTAVKWGFKG